jgi:hypothetical protein
MKFARIALKVVMQNGGDFVEVILLYTYKHVFIYTEQFPSRILQTLTLIQHKRFARIINKI